MTKTSTIDSTLLKEKINESGLKSSYIADTLGISRQSFSNKIKGETSFRASEVYVMCDLLRLDGNERIKIFFPNVSG
jgi:predicted transcriptional regulator